MSEERQTIIVPSWHSQPVETSKGEQTEEANEGKRAPNGAAIGAAQLGEAGQVVLMLGLTHGPESLAAVFSLDEWNRFTASIQLALMDAARLEVERLRQAGQG